MNESVNASCVLIGVGGHAVVLLEALLAADRAVPAIGLDGDAELHGTVQQGVRIVGGDDMLPEMPRLGITHFVLGVGTGSDTATRRRLFENARAAGLNPLNVRHPSSLCSPSAELGPGIQLLARGVVNARAKLGESVLINTAAIVEHHCVVEDHVHLATGAILCGGATVRSGALIGAGAIIKHGVVVGRNAVVGAGAVVIDDVADDAVVAGIPARRIERSR